MTNLDTIYGIDERTLAFERHERGVLVCLAGPGTGKTFSLLARSQALVAREHPQDSICYLTFIGAIAEAFVDDYVQRFGEHVFATSAPRISTLHSFACRVIRNQGFRIKYDGELHFANLAEGDTAGETFLRDLLPLVSGQDCRTVPQLRSIVEEIKGAWQDDRDPAPCARYSSAIMAKMAELSRCYRLLDWDQTIPVATELLSGCDELPEWLAKIKHYFVDEYQDFNKAEHRLIRYLADNATSTVIVGDDDQSLYSGRGGSPAGIRQLYEDPANDQVTLAKCYRCKASIVAPTNVFQAQMSATPRPMNAASGGGQVACYRFKSSKAEIEFLTEFLAEKLRELPENPRPKDAVVCLFPSKRILNAYFDMLSPLVACTRRAHVISEKREWLERILSLLVNPNQRYVQRLLLTSYDAVKPRHCSTLVRYVVERDISPSDACKMLISEKAFSGPALLAAQAFVDLCANLSAGDVSAIAPEIATVAGVDPQTVVDELRRLVDTDEPPESFIQEVCDSLMPDTATPDIDVRSVTFLTMHGSKGLTRKTVVMPGLEEACLPNGGDPSGLPEKKRLFFVALSRATDCLLITLPHNRGRSDSLNFDMPGRGNPSSFLAAAGLAPQYHE
jgi:DNA helicase-2/ATP-dependent DNA helicase PcrA